MKYIPRVVLFFLLLFTFSVRTQAQKSSSADDPQVQELYAEAKFAQTSARLTTIWVLSIYNNVNTKKQSPFSKKD